MALGISAGTWLLAGTAVGSALIGSNSASKAADKQVGAANNATDFQKSMFNQTQGNLRPYMDQGSSALSTLTSKMNSGELGGNFTGADYLANKDPGYEFQLNQGNQALMNSQAATNGSLSGAALKSLIGFNQGTAATGYQSAFSRWMQSQQNTYGQLSDVARLGENAGANVGNSGVGYANGISNSMMGAGNAGASGIMGGANALGGGLNTLGSLAYMNGNNSTYIPGYGNITNSNLNNPNANMGPQLSGTGP